MIARLARVFLVVALLAGWQAALLHPLQHADSQGALVHLGEGRTSPAQSDNSKLCDVLAALTACAPHAPLTFVPLAAEQHGFGFSETRLRAAEAPPFLAQGPPSFL